MKRLLFLIIPALIFAEAIFQKGNSLYEQGLYAEAQDAYQAAIDSGYISSEVYYNLGNAHFKNNQNAQAILAYERALVLNPRDEQTAMNLAYARMYCPDKINSMFEGTFLGNFWTLLRYFTYSEVRYATIILGGIAAIFLFFFIIGVRKKRRPLKRLSIFFGVLALIAFGIYIVKLNDRWLLDSAIVMKPETDVSSSPTDSGELLFTINPGTKVVIHENYQDHCRIAIEDGREGWVSEQALEMITPSAK